MDILKVANLKTLSTLLILAACLLPSWTLISIDHVQSKCTDIEKEHVTYNWTVRNLYYVLNGPQEQIPSPSFFTSNNSDEWRLVLHPTVWVGGRLRLEHTGVYLQLVTSSKENISAHWNMTIFKSGQVLAAKRFMHTYKFLETRGDNEFIETPKLLRDGDELTVRCELDLPFRIVEVPCEEPVASQNLAIPHDIRSLFENMNSSDVTKSYQIMKNLYPELVNNCSGRVADLHAN